MFGYRLNSIFVGFGLWFGVLNPDPQVFLEDRSWTNPSVFRDVLAVETQKKDRGFFGHQIVGESLGLPSPIKPPEVVLGTSRGHQLYLVYQCLYLVQ